MHGHHHQKHRHISTPAVASMRNDHFINDMYKNPPNLDARHHKKTVIDVKQKYQAELEKLQAKGDTKRRLLLDHQKEHRSHLAQKQHEKHDRLAQDQLLHNQQQKARLDRKQVHAQTKFMQAHETKQQKQVQDLKVSQAAERQHLQEKQAKQVSELKGRQERDQLQFKHQQEAQFRKQQRQQLELHQRQVQKNDKQMHELTSHQKQKREEMLGHQLSDRHHQDEKLASGISHLQRKHERKHPELFADQSAVSAVGGERANGAGGQATLFGRLTGWWNQGGQPLSRPVQGQAQAIVVQSLTQEQAAAQASQSTGIPQSQAQQSFNSLAPPPQPAGPQLPLQPHAEGGKPLSGLNTAARILAPGQRTGTMNAL